MPIYYLVLETFKEPIEIGTESFNNFWCAQGWKILNRKIKNSDISNIKIIDSNSKKYSIREFLSNLYDRKINIIEQ
jgi:hypothetical protein